MYTLKIAKAAKNETNEILINIIETLEGKLEELLLKMNSTNIKAVNNDCKTISCFLRCLKIMRINLHKVDMR